MKKIAILQSNYIPWKGYFDMIAAVDEFILFDDVKYTHQDWRNRNQIKTSQGMQWLTIPIKHQHAQAIRETKIAKPNWATTHWKALQQNYRCTPHFNEIAEWLEPLYLTQNVSHLSVINRQFIEAICKYLSIQTTISHSWDYAHVEGKTERLVHLCKQANAVEYISGPAAKGYIKTELFAQANIKLTWFDYMGYPEYPQCWGTFVHSVTILDLLFNCGKEAHRYMRYV